MSLSRFNNPIFCTDSTDSTGASSGSLNLAGGASITKNLYVGGTITAISNFTTTNATTSGSAEVAALFSPSLAAAAGNANRTEIHWGISDTTSNCGILNFNYIGSGLSTNSIGIGFYGSNQVLQLYPTGIVSVPSTTDSTSSTSGAFQVAGGVGVAKSLYAGGSINLGTNTYTALLWSNGAALGYAFLGGQYVSNAAAGDIVLRTTNVTTGTNNIRIATNSTASSLDVLSSGIIAVNTTTDSSSTTTGALQVAGGVGIAKTLIVGSSSTGQHLIQTTSTTDAVRIQNLNASGYASIQFANSSSAIVGYIGIGCASVSAPYTGNMYVTTGTGANFVFSSSFPSVQIQTATDSTSATTGALQVAGGVGIGKSLYVGSGIKPVYGQGMILCADVYNNFKFAASTGTWQISDQTGANIFQLYNSTTGGGGYFVVNATTDSTSTTSGALQVAGGVGIAKNLTVNNKVTAATISVGGAASTAYGNFSMIGTNSSIPGGPHMNYYVSTDTTYPVFQQLNYTHDNIALSFDTYDNANGWASSYSGTNAQIYKISGQLRFNAASGVTAGSTITWTQAMLIDLATTRVNIAPTLTTTPGSGRLNVQDYNGTLMCFYYGSTAVGTISTGGSSTAYNTTSDYRLKENVKELKNAQERVSKLQTYRFNFKGDEKIVDGFFAHEVADIVPEAITGEKDAVDENGNIVPQGIDHSKLVPLLTAALQETMEELRSLRKRVDAMEKKA
ncbi:unnamed protein product [Sphagnum tenellum]